MKKKSLSVFFLAVCAILAATDHRELLWNPVVRALPSHVTLYISFDEDSTRLDIGLGKDVTRAGSHVFGDGVSGRALRAGRVQLPPKGLIDTAAPGCLIFWMAMSEPPEKRAVEPGASFFVLNLPERKRILLFRQGGRAWGTGILQLRAEIGKKVCAINISDPAEWIEPGRWRMIAVNWGPERLGLSLDGRPMQYASLIAPPGRSDRYTLLFPAPEKKDLDKPEKLHYLLDEIVILDRNLSDGEIRKFYEDSLHQTDKNQKE